MKTANFSNSKKEIYENLLKLVSSEKGCAVNPESKLSDAGLDSLGLTFVLIELDSKYRILKNIDSGKEYEQLNLATITIKDFVNLCKKSLLENTATTE